MEPRISLITLGVADLSRALRFYRDGLGWPLSRASVGDIAFFQAGGVVLALYPRTLLAADARQPDEGHGFGGITLAHNVRQRADVDRVLNDAVTAGGHLLKPAEEADWGGYSGYFADPDGHPWEVAWNPHFPFNQDGSVRLPEADSADGAAEAETDSAITKADLLPIVEASQRRFDEAIAGLDDAAMIEPGVVEQWSIKDLVSHIAAWEHLVVQYLERWRRGEPALEPTWSSADEYNAGESARRHTWTLTQVRDDAAETRRRLQALLVGMTDEKWDMQMTMRGRERPLGAWVGGALSGDDGPGTHAAEHARQIVAWRSKRESGRAPDQQNERVGS